MTKPERIDLDLKQVDALLKRTKELLPPEDYEIIKAMADTIYLLSQSVDKKAASIQRLLRCNLCGEIFTADTPEGVGEEKYDTKSKAMIAFLKYGSGMPFTGSKIFSKAWASRCRHRHSSKLPKIWRINSTRFIKSSYKRPLRAMSSAMMTPL